MIHSKQVCHINFNEMLLDGNQFWTVYILLCSDGTYYTGCTENLEKRLKKHRNQEVGYTKSRIPLELVFCASFVKKHRAYAFEKYLKSGSGKAFSKRRFI